MPNLFSATLRPYVLDTSALADMLERHYPPELFPQVQDMLETLAHDRRLIVPYDVYSELSTSPVVAWLDSLDSVVHDLDNNVQITLGSVMSAVGAEMVNPRGTKNAADPIVVAFAKTYRGTVVTAEKSNPGSKWKKIPDACAELSVACLSVIDFLHQERHLMARP